MKNKIITYLLLINFMSLVLIPINIHANENLWWNNNWSFRQEIVLPIETDMDIAKYQPIDIHVVFDNSCWAKNEYEHSMRVIYEDGEYFEELDSQIYDLEYDKNNFISACNVVFLIPEKANGREHYFVYYDKEVKNAPNYTDHVSIEESHYFYEPVAGYPIKSEYFKIIEDGFVIYVISKEGEFMGYTTSQHVTKLKEKTTEVFPKNGELIASFEFCYYYGHGMTDFSSSSQKLVTDITLIDGNLMVEFGINSESSIGDIQTNAIYKYYYCPNDYKRLQAHVKHKVNEEIRVARDTNTDGRYVKLQCGGVRSKSIQDLNFGEIFPYIHLNNEKDIVDEYTLDPDPEYIPDDYDIRVLSNKDDVDLGTPSWVCFDYGDSGIAHSIIFSSNQVIKSGKGERDGLQINSYEMDYPHFPGIETNRAILEIGRNSYEIGGNQDLLIPKDFEVEFDAEFFSSKDFGYKTIQKEASIFHSLAEIKPDWTEGFSDEIEKSDGHKLSIIVHNAYSFPFGAAFSALTGKKFSYISAELYKDDEIIYCGTPVRFKFNSEYKDTNNLKWLVSTFYPVDWKNISIFKELTFNDLETGRYLIKIYRENPFLSKYRKYIGFKIIEIKKDVKTHVFCKSEGIIQISVKDIEENPIIGSEIRILKEDVIIAKNFTDSSGQMLLRVPFAETYTLEISYNGFILFKDNVNLPRISKILPIKKIVDVELNVFNLEVVDTWDLPSTLLLNPVITSNKMNEPTLIYPEKLSQVNYYFSQLISSKYQLSIQYKSFSIKEEIVIPKNKELKIVFPAEFNIKLNTLDTRGLDLSDASIVLSREDKNINLKSNQSGVTILLPPGVYNVKILNEDEIIGSRKINVLGERSFDLITINAPLYPYIATVMIFIIILLSIIICYIKKYSIYFLKILSISFASLSIMFPWWILQGMSSQVETFTKMYLIPLELVTITTYGAVIGGELAYLPELFVYANSFIPFITLVGCFLVLGSIFVNRYNNKLGLFLISTSFMCFIISILIFSYSMSQLTEIGIGSFIGKENLEIKIPGEEISKSVLCSWGPTIGFYLHLLSLLSIFSTYLIILKKKVYK